MLFCFDSDAYLVLTCGGVLGAAYSNVTHCTPGARRGSPAASCSVM